MAHEPTERTPWPRALALASVLAAAVSIIVLAFSWPGVTSDAQNLPIAIVGDSAQATAVQQALEDKAPGVFTFTDAGDRDAAVVMIQQRQIYGAIIVAQPPEVLTASAASPLVSQLMGTVALQLPGEAVVTDVVPLVAVDPRGAGLAAAIFPLVIGGLLGGIAITILILGAVRRVLALWVYAIGAGFAIPGILQGWFGVLPGAYFAHVGVFALALLAIGAPIAGLAALVGRRGLAIGPVLFLLVGNPIASAATPLEFLPQPWGLVGQWLPPGAGAPVLREVSYFPDANLAFPALVLSAWALVGILLAMAGHYRTFGAARHSALAEADLTA